MPFKKRAMKVGIFAPITLSMGDHSRRKEFACLVKGTITLEKKNLLFGGANSLMLSTLGKNFSIQYFKILFISFLKKQASTFHAGDN